MLLLERGLEYRSEQLFIHKLYTNGYNAILSIFPKAQHTIASVKHAKTVYHERLSNRFYPRTMVMFPRVIETFINILSYSGSFDVDIHLNRQVKHRSVKNYNFLFVEKILQLQVLN